MFVIKQLQIALLIVLLSAGMAYGQDSDLKKMVDAIRGARTESLLARWRVESAAKSIDVSKARVPTVFFYVYLDEAFASDEVLNKLTLDDVTQVALSFDPGLMVRGGAVGYNGVILVTSKKSKLGKL